MDWGRGAVDARNPEALSGVVRRIRRQSTRIFWGGEVRQHLVYRRK